MMPVEQTAFFPDGNCMEACVASILEIPIANVAKIASTDDTNWWAGFCKWLAGRGLKAAWANIADTAVPGGYAIIGARSPRADVLHAVVALDGIIVWDPHPDRAMGVGEWVDWVTFAPIELSDANERSDDA
jgi:hypothetical protein